MLREPRGPYTDPVNKPPFSERFRYWFDSVMAKGTIAIMGLLAVATLIFVVVIAAIVAILNIGPDDKPVAFPEAMWESLMRTLDPGTMGGDEGVWFRVAMLTVTIGGLIIVASLIGIVSSAFDTKVEELRKGRSRVLENDHTLILGWSPKVFPIISELSIANQSRGRSAIVILAPGDKVEMEDAIHREVGKTGKTRVIVRSGDPMNLSDLAVSNPQAARSIIILAPEDSVDADSAVIKTALALTNNPQRKEGDYHIVGEIQDAANLEAARLVGRHEAHWILASDLISRVTVQTSRQSGLSVVYTELLDFDGDEIYFTEQPTLVGKTYFDAQVSFANASVMGMVSAGTVTINPAPDTVIADDTQLIVIASDDDAIHLGVAPATIDTTRISAAAEKKAVPERTLILGFNASIDLMLAELNEYVAAESTVTVVADIETPALAKYKNVAVTFQRGDTTNRAVLDGLTVVDYDHIIVLAYKETLEPQRADAKTLVTLLHLRDIAERAEVDLNVVSEMLDDGNRELAEVTQADDFIVSDKIISLMLSQISENQQLTEVFSTLFSSDGSEIYLRPVELYVTAGASVDFYTVLEAARRRGESAIGYRVEAHAHDGSRQYGVVVNPTKGEQIGFVAGDRIIVLAED